MIRFAAVVLSLVMCSVAVGQQSVFDVRRFGATGDGTTNDTTAIQNAFDAAAAYTAANTVANAVVIVPRGVYMVAGTSGTSGYCVNLSGSRIALTGEGAIKMVAADDAGCVLQVAGDYNTIVGITIDGNAAGVPTDRGEGLRITGDYNTIRNVTAQNTKTTGSTGATFFDFGGEGNLFVDCISKSSGWVGFRMGGNNWTVRDCKAIDHADNGLSATGGDCDGCLIDGFYFTSTVDNLGTSGILLDVAYDDNTGYMIKQATIKHVRGVMGRAGFIPMKIAHIENCLIEDFWCDHTSDVSSLKIAESIHKLTIRNSYFPRVIDQDPAGDGTGTITDTEYVEVQTIAISGTPTGGSFTITHSGGTTAAITHTTAAPTTAALVQTALRAVSGLSSVTVTQSGTGTNLTFKVRFDGFSSGVDPAQMTSTSSLTGGAPAIAHATLGGVVKFTSASHGLTTQDNVVVTGTTSHDGLHVITVADTNTFTTNLKWVADNETGEFFNVVGDFKLENVTIGDRTHRVAGGISGVRAYDFSVTGCDFRGYQNFAVGLDNVLATESVFHRINITKNRFESLDISTQPWLLAWDVGQGTNSGQTLDSNVVHIEDNQVIDSGSLATRGVLGNSQRMRTLAANETITAADSGAALLVGAADLTLTLPSSATVGEGVVFRFQLTAAGLSSSTGLAISPNSADKIMGNGFVSADNQDLILRGATDREGDSVTIVSDGVDGWYIANRVGHWSSQSGQTLPTEPTAMVANTSEVGNVGTGVDDLISYTLPANSILSVGGSLEIEAGFTFAANANNKEVKLLINGVSHYASGAVAQNGGSMVLKMTVICDSATVTKFSTTVQTTGSGAIPNVALVNGGLMTITNSNIIKCTGEATATNDIVQEYLRVRVIPAP